MSALIQYVTQESITVRRQTIAVLISEYVDGELLSEFIARQPGRRLHRFEALHLLHAMAAALEPCTSAANTMEIFTAAM